MSLLFGSYTVVVTLTRRNIFKNFVFGLFIVTSYEELLLKDGTIFLHYRNIQTLAIGIFKVKNELSPEIMSDIFTQRIGNHYKLRNISHFETTLVRTVYNGTEVSSYPENTRT